MIEMLVSIAKFEVHIRQCLPSIYFSIQVAQLITKNACTLQLASLFSLLFNFDTHFKFMVSC